MALATSKRKFYKILDNLSSSKLHTPTQVPTETDESTANARPVKRSRMPAATPTRPMRVVSSTSVRLISSTFETGNKSVSSSPGSIRQTTTYAPWSHEQFLDRLKTFADVKVWTSKPAPIDDVPWAKRGWTVVGQDELACRTCSKHLLVKLDVDADDEDENKEDDDTSGGANEAKWWFADSESVFIERYETLIVEGHMTDCLWRKSGCKDDIYRIKFSDSAQWQAELVERYSGLAALSTALPDTVLQPRSTTDSQQPAFHLEAIVKLFGSKLTHQTIAKENARSTPKPSAVPKPAVNTTSDPKPNKTALLMALCGWTGQRLAGVEIASCPKCFTRVGLWLYSQTSDSAIEEEMKFDPAMLHRSHCPWQNPQSQSGVGSYSGLAGWEILADMLRVEMRRSDRHNAAITDGREHSDAEDSTSSPRLSKDEVDLEDKVRESKLAKLKRAFSVKNTLKKSQRPLSSRSVASFKSGRSMFSKGDQT